MTELKQKDVHITSETIHRKNYKMGYQLRTRSCVTSTEKLSEIANDVVLDSDNENDPEEQDSGLENSNVSAFVDAPSADKGEDSEDDSNDEDYDPLSDVSFSSEDEQEEKDLKIQIQSIVDNIQDVSCSNQFNASADRDKDIIRGNISKPLHSAEKLNTGSIENELNASILTNHFDKRLKHGHKKHVCLYCKLPLWKLSRHLLRKHKSEDEIKDLLKYPVESIKRKNAIQLLIRKGDYEFNMMSLKKDSSRLCVVRQLKSAPDNVSIMNFVPCTHCFGFFNASTLFKHVKTCPMRGDVVEKRPLAASRALVDVQLGQKKFHDVYDLILSRMTRRDEAFILIKADSTLLSLAASSLHSKEKDRYNDIRYSLRVLATLILRFREIVKKGDLKSDDLVLPENYENVLEAAQYIAGYHGPRKIDKPNVFRKIGFCLSNLSLVVRAEALKKGDTVCIEKCRQFMELRESDWEIYANNAKAVYTNRKANIPEELPDEKDVQTFRDFCIEEIKSQCKKDPLNPTDYRQLMKVTLCRVMTFNARRGGEVSKLTVAQWDAVEDDRWKRRFDIQEINDPVERKLAERLKLCYIEGKKKNGNRSALVPILFTEESVEAIRILITKRSTANISKDNEFVFACGEQSLRGWDTLQAITKQISGLVKPQLITPTRTRKLLATMLQVLDMTEAEVTWVTNHMGHSKDVHFAWYRKEDATIELTKMAKVLTAVDQGESLKSKKIDDILNNEIACHKEKSSGKCQKRKPRLEEFDNAKDENETSNVLTGVTAIQRKATNEIPPVQKKKKKGWNPWTADETNLLHRQFRSHFLQRVVPMHHEILSVMEHCPVLKKRGKNNLKDKFKAELKKMNL